MARASTSTNQKPDETQSGQRIEAEHSPLLDDTGWLEILENHRDCSPAEFVLRYGGKSTWPVREIAEQLKCYPRAVVKLGPFHRPGMIYLREALEQSSGYATAVFRAGEWMPDSGSKAPLIADVTGGLGIDAAAWARAGANVCYIEKNRKLGAIARHNHRILEVDGRINHSSGDGMAWLTERNKNGNPPLDLLFIDPSRRLERRRVITLEESEPSVPDNMALITSSARRYLLKLSPMLDTTRLRRQLAGLHKIVAVSVGGEVKELLADGFGSEGVARSTSSPHTESASTTISIIHQAVLLNKQGEEWFRITSDNSMHPPEVRPAATFLYEPDPAILKMRLAGELSTQFQLGFLNRATGYLTGEEWIPDFPGRKYTVRESHPWKPKKLRKFLAEKKLRNVHIHQRGFPLSVDQLYAKLGCTMGDQAHLIATTDHQGQFVLYITDLS